MSPPASGIAAPPSLTTPTRAGFKVLLPTHDFSSLDGLLAGAGPFSPDARSLRDLRARYDQHGALTLEDVAARLQELIRGLQAQTRKMEEIVEEARRP